MPTISIRGNEMPASPIRKLAPLADAAKQRGVHVFHLNIGQPDLPTPQVAIDAIRNIDRKVLEYSPSAGYRSYREKLVGYYAKFNINLTADDIIITSGGSEAVLFSFLSCLNPGDEIIVPEPAYANYMAFAISAGAKIRTIATTIEEGFSLPKVEKFEELINERTKAILICNPNNPTGALYPKEILEQIVELAREHELLIFADEIYDRLVMDGKQHISIASLAPDLCVVSFNGLSKSHLIAGYRCGWMCISGDKSRAKGYIEGINLLSSMRLCANVPTQSVIPKALEMLDSTKEMLEPGGRVYEQREYIYNALNDIPGVSAVKPEAAFYIFPKMDMKKFHIKDDEKFALDFLKEKKILVTHGGGFHWNTPDHFRIVYLPDVDTLTEACTRMKDFFAHYVQD
mgnify:CR=1 FL=1